MCQQQQQALLSLPGWATCNCPAATGTPLGLISCKSFENVSWECVIWPSQVMPQQVVVVQQTVKSDSS